MDQSGGSESSPSFLASLFRTFPAFQSKKRPNESRPFQQNFKRAPRNDRNAGSSLQGQSFRGGSLRDLYWNRDGTGPIMETKKFAGTQIDFPKVAPLRAKTEDKKLILAQTARRLENASDNSATWAARTDFIVNRFLGTVPHASNEAEINLAKFDLYGSDLYDYGPPQGLTNAYAPTAIQVGRRTSLWFLQLEMRIYPKQLVTDHMEVPGLPEVKTLEILLRLPRNEQQDALHPSLSVENLSDPMALFRLLPEIHSRIELGLLDTRLRRFDPSLFQKEIGKIKHECKFWFVKAVLLRDYVGQGLLPDLENRLQACRQVTFQNGRMRVKPMAEHHADFMRLVQELQLDEDVPVNLASIEFHNLSNELKTELLSNKYTVPSNTSSIGQQYKNLSELVQKATEAERRIKQVSTLIRNTVGSQHRPTINTSAYLTCMNGTMGQEDIDQDDYFYENPYEEDEQESEPNEPREIHAEAYVCRHFLSVAENALRNASGEAVPLKCWGCGEIPEYAKNCFHRFGDCPYKPDPRVLANFKINIEKWQAGRQQRTQQSKYGPAKYPPTTNRTSNTVNQAGVTFEENAEGTTSMVGGEEPMVFTSRIEPPKPNLDTPPPPRSDKELCTMIGLTTNQQDSSGKTVFQTFLTPVKKSPPSMKLQKRGPFQMFRTPAMI